MTGKTVELRAKDGGTFSGYLSTPKEGAGPGVVVLQEIFGVNANMRSVADWLAASGYFAVVPDLFWRQKPNVELNPGSETDREQATALMKGMDFGLAIQDALAAADYLRSVPGCTGKIGTVGYCLGGRLAYGLATTGAIDAAVSYYGVQIQAALDKVSAIKKPLILHIAAADHLCPPEAQDQILKAVASNSAITAHVYPNVGHAFARSGGGPTFNAEAATLANDRTLKFFATYLR